MTEKWKSTVGIELQELLRQKGISQGRLAAFLGLKAASVTYLLQGKIKLTQERLEQILVFLHADSATIRHFEQMQHANSRSENNNACFACRCRAGLKTETVSEQTGIPVNRLQELENTPEAVPSSSELEALKLAYCCEAGALLGIIPLNETPNRGALEQVCESRNESLNAVQISILDSAGLGHYRKEEDFLEFLKKYRSKVDIIELEKKKNLPVAKIQFSSSRLGWDMKGTIEIFLGSPEQEAPSGLYLGRGTHGVFRLWKHRGHFWTPFFSAFGEKKSKPAWFLPVTEFCFRPES